MNKNYNAPFGCELRNSHLPENHEQFKPTLYPEGFVFDIHLITHRNTLKQV